jgi:hypothetical protein
MKLSCSCTCCSTQEDLYMLLVEFYRAEILLLLGRERCMKCFSEFIKINYLSEKKVLPVFSEFLLHEIDTQLNNQSIQSNIHFCSSNIN